MALVSFPEMQDVIASAFINAGMLEHEAQLCARIHTEATLDGVNSHGLNRVARFVDYVGKGWVNLAAKPTLVKQLGAIEIYDGGRAPGVLNAIFSTDRAMQMASHQGVGIVALRNTTHWMRGGAYGWRAADQGYVAISWTNTESVMPAWGGRDSRVGNNPFVIAVPRKKGHLVLDMAMSQYSYGKLQTTRLKGRKLPFPGGFDKAGNLTDEPGPIEASMRILPMGYWKGSGFAIMLDVLAAVLSEGAPTHAIDKIQEGSGELHRLLSNIHPDRPGEARWRKLHRRNCEQRGRLCAQVDSGGGQHGNSVSRRKRAKHETEAEESRNPCRRRRLERSPEAGCE
jgi:3-dehydro-L-gulonate 2-dehydrogenase